MKKVKEDTALINKTAKVLLYHNELTCLITLVEQNLKNNLFKSFMLERLKHAKDKIENNTQPHGQDNTNHRG